jgi:type III pantothenate kinase
MNSAALHPMLVADAGNSSVKFALVSRPGARPRPLARLANESLAAPQVQRVARSAKARSAVAASVVPAITRILTDAIPDLAVIGPATPLEFPCLADRRVTGADRLANMAAAARLHGRRVLVADFGTAATFDALDARGRFVGGAIAPGLRGLGRTLAAATALLPETTLLRPRRLAGRNTGEALRAGLLAGYAGLVRHLLDGLGREVFGRQRPLLVLTGGDAAAVARLAGLTGIVDPLWTLRGIAILGGGGVREASKQARSGAARR